MSATHHSLIEIVQHRDAYIAAGRLWLGSHEWQIGGVAALPVSGYAGWVGLKLDRRARRSRQWWRQEAIGSALVAAGILPAPKEGDLPPKVRFRGKRVTDAAGTAVTFALPKCVVYADCAPRRSQLAAALRVPLALFDLSPVVSAPPNVVRIWVGVPQSSATVPAAVGKSEAADSSQPVRIGRGSTGQVVELATNESNCLIAGVPGSGKTSLARILLSHYLLDASATVFLLDGKGSRKDYGSAKGLCARYVSGVEETAVEDTVEMLKAVLDIVRGRNAAGSEECPPGVLVLLEEYQDIRASADKAVKDELDVLLGRIVRMGRAIGVVVVVSTQRPSVDDLPSGVRNLINQRVALQLRNGADAALVLGQAPTLALPTKRGEALLTTPVSTLSVQLDRLTDAAWRDVVTRARQLRPKVAAIPVAVVEEAKAPADPLLSAVLDILLSAPVDGLTATALLAALPGDVAPDSVVALGRKLAAFAAAGAAIEGGKVGRSRAWRILRRIGEVETLPRLDGVESAVSTRRGTDAGTDAVAGLASAGSVRASNVVVGGWTS
ncbi:MAG TPA: AAA family ATPase [Dermatophilaceae bacterium]